MPFSTAQRRTSRLVCVARLFHCEVFRNTSNSSWKQCRSIGAIAVSLKALGRLTGSVSKAGRPVYTPTVFEVSTLSGIGRSSGGLCLRFPR